LSELPALLPTLVSAPAGRQMHVNMSLRKIAENRGSFPNDDALLQLFYLALRNISQKWPMPIRDWKAALIRFTIQLEERMTQHY